MWPRVPRVLHQRMVHCWQETDLPLLSREGGPEEDVPQPLGEGGEDVRPAAGLGEVAGLLAASHTGPGSGE